MRQTSFPAAVTYELTQSGVELLETAAILETWLRTSPEGPLRLADRRRRAQSNPLVDALDDEILRALAAKPLSLTELGPSPSGVNIRLWSADSARCAGRQIHAAPAETAALRPRDFGG